MPQHRPDEVSAGGVLARPAAGGWEVCLVLVKGNWGLPKGHLESGETPRQAALREISEECGVPGAALTIVAELAPSEYVYRRAGRLSFKLVHQFVVTTDPDRAVVAQAGEIDETRWMSLEEASALASFTATRTALSAARTVLGMPPS